DRPAEPEREEGPHRGDGVAEQGPRAAHGAPRQGADPAHGHDDAHAPELRSPGGLRALARERRVGRALDPEAVPDVRGGRAPDLRPPARAQGDRPELEPPHPTLSPCRGRGMAYSLRPITGAIWRSSRIRSSNM